MDIYAFCAFLIDADGVRYAASRLSSDIIMAIRGRNSGYKQLSIWNHFKTSAVNIHNICHYMKKDVAKVNSRFYFLLLIFSLKNVYHFLAFILCFWSLLESSSRTQHFVRRKCSWKNPFNDSTLFGCSAVRIPSSDSKVSINIKTATI